MAIATLLGRAVAAAVLVLTFSAAHLDAQIGGRLRDAAARLGTKNLVEMLEKDPPISTSLDDARFGAAWLDHFRPDAVEYFRGGPRFAVDSLDNFVLRAAGIPEPSLDPLRSVLRRGIPVDSLDNFPAVLGQLVPVDSLDSLSPRSLLDLQRTAHGGFILEPGYWELHTQSYCLKAGTHGPGGGDGYLFAPPEGAAEEQVVAILRNSVHHPEIAQSDIQQLLWAIIARAKFEDLNPRLKQVATQLLTPRQVATLNRNALDMVPDQALEQALAQMPPLVRQAFQAEAQLRKMLIDPAASFASMEAIAVLSGAVGLGPGSREVSSDRWSAHPDGYLVRYLPRGYSHTLVQMWVPQGSAAVGKEYDPARHIAVPGNTARQRLIQSGRPVATE
jgi:hypothetical protein